MYETLKVTEVVIKLEKVIELFNEYCKPKTN